MEVHCSSCQRSIEYSHDAPRFCSNCGEPLPETDSGNAATLSHVFDSATARPPAAGDLRGAGRMPERVGQYRLIEELGRGGMGIVYKAEEETTGRLVALKLLTPRLRGSSVSVDRFLREGKLAASLSHPRTTFVYAAGQQDGQFYITMELMTGGTLANVVQDSGPLPAGKAVDYALDIIDGLAAAHETGMIHRDMKPSNCFLDSDGRVKVGDFGLAKSLVGDSSLTQTGAFLGTPQFAAPEQIKAGEVDEQTDIYAVGATLYYLLAGEGPFAGDAAKVIAAIASEPVPPLHHARADLPRGLDPIIAQTLQKDPALRPQSLSQLRLSLLPFSSRGSSIADLGRRMGALFVDLFLIQLSAVVLFMGVLLGVIAVTQSFEFNHTWLPLLLPAISIAAALLYIGIPEGIWGCSAGKSLLGIRVIGILGSPPGVPRAMLRALFIPGLMILVSSVPSAGIYEFGSPINEGRSQWQRIGATLGPQFFFLAGWGVSLLCVATMRRSNGMRGIHELLTGTRVVRQSRGDEELWRRIPVTLSVEADPRMIGGFRVRGKLGHGPVTVWRAEDTSLGRTVWVHEHTGTAASAERMAVSRSTRPRWLAGGDAKNGRWEAYEGVTGVPLVELIHPYRGLDWRIARRVLADLSSELLAASDDGTLPGTLSPEQIWVDRKGRANLLDVPVRPLSAGKPDLLDDAPSSEAARAVALLRRTAELCCRPLVLPGTAQDVLEELAERPADAETLAWAAERFQELADQPGELRWDQRLGVMAASFTAEWSVLQILAMTLAVLISLLPGLDIVGNASIVFPFCLLLPAVLGFAFRGGPVFWFAGVQVRDRRGRIASRLRCGWRNFVAWLPLTFGFAAEGVYVAAVIADGNAAADPAISGGFGCVWGLACLLMLIGAIFAVANPSRGLPDYLSRTYLVPQ